MKPHFENRYGYIRHPQPPVGGTERDEFILLKPPLTWVNRVGSWLPDAHLETDSLSGSWLSASVLHCTQGRFAWVYFHDSGYACGGLWLAKHHAPREFVLWPKEALDEELIPGIRADGGSWWQAGATWVFFKCPLFAPVSWTAWHRHEDQRKLEIARAEKIMGRRALWLDQVKEREKQHADAA